MPWAGPGFGEKRAQDGHAALHRVGGKQDFRHKQDTIAKIDSNDGHAANQRFSQNAVRLPATLQKDVDALFDLFLETVIEIILHLLDQLIIVERA